MQPRSPWFYLTLALVAPRILACSDAPPETEPAPSAPGEGGKSAAGAPSAGMATGTGGSFDSGGSPARGGATAPGTGGAGTGGNAGGTPAAGGRANTGGTVAAAGSATGGSVGAVGGAGVADFVCPAGPYAEHPVPGGGTPTRIQGVPPSDDFIASDSELIILEGPVWFDGNLYVSQINNGVAFGPGFPGGFGGRSGGSGGQGGGGTEGGGGAGGSAGKAPPPSRILKITPQGEVTLAVADAGTNGLAVSPEGQLLGCSHKTGSIARFGLTGEAPVELVTEYMGARFNSPNDLTFGVDGTLYFTDPDYQAPSPRPQAATRAYRVPPGSTTAVPLIEDRPQPNGVTLSPDRKTLYVSASDGVYAYPVSPDGNIGAGTPFGQGIVRSSDGMAVDCAGNLYTTSGQTVLVLTPAGAELARISVPEAQQVTNVAFGGAAHTKLYITAQGTSSRSGLFELEAAIPGMPY